MEFDGTPLMFHTSSTVHAIWSMSDLQDMTLSTSKSDPNLNGAVLEGRGGGGNWSNAWPPLELGTAGSGDSDQKPWCIWGIKHIFEIGWDYQLFSTVILNISQLSNSVSHYFHTIPTFQKFLRVMHCTPDCFVNRLPPQRALGPSTTKAWAPSSPAYSRLTSVCKVVCLVSH